LGGLGRAILTTRKLVALKRRKVPEHQALNDIIFNSLEESAMSGRIESLFHAARMLPPSEREAYLRGACGQDLGLRAKVDALLAADA
jgi:hypothetical protein